MSNNFPTIKPSLNLQFANTGILPPDVTFTRASSSGGYYDGKTVVKAEENLFLRSQEFESVLWIGLIGTKPGVTANAATAPDGTATADLLLFNAQFKAIGQTGKTSTGVEYTFSIFLRVASGTRVLSIATIGGVIIGTFTVTDEFQRFVYTGTDFTTSWAIQDRNAADFINVEAWGAQLEERSFVTAYTPTTTQPITRFQPKLEYAITNEPVFDHNPVTGEALGLSVWEARTNLLLRSQEFDNAYWIKTPSSLSTFQGAGSQAAVTVNQGIAPDGTLTAARVQLDLNGGTTSADRSGFYCDITVSNATNYAGSFYIKPLDNTTKEQIELATNLGVLAADGVATSSIKSVGNGWYFVSRVLTTGTTSGTFRFQLIGGGVIDSIDCFIWGAQLEAGTFATPYIPTVASTVTRSAELPVMTGANFSRWYRADEGTMAAEFLVAGYSSFNSAFSLDADVSNAIQLSLNSAGIPRLSVEKSGTEANLTQGSATFGTYLKIAGAYEKNDFAASRDGGTATSDNSGVLPVVNRAVIGNVTGQNRQLNGYIKSIQYYPKRLTNAELQAVTA